MVAPQAPLPPSTGQDGVLHEMRFLAQSPTGAKAVGSYGSRVVLAILGCIVVVFIVSAAYIGLLAQSEINVAVTSVSAELGPCQTAPGVVNGQQEVLFTIGLMNSGTRNAVVVLHLYLNGTEYGTAGGFTIPAGSLVFEQASVLQYTCGPVTPSADILSAGPAQ